MEYEEIKAKIRTVDGLVNDWYKSILPENNKLTLKYSKWDKEFKGKLRGKLVPIIGYGGTKKSLLSLNIAYENVVQGLGTCLYSTMEMGNNELINRLIDLHIQSQDGYNPHSELEYHNNTTKKIDAKSFYNKEFAPFFKDRFFVTETGSLEAKHYDNAINDLKKNGINIDILIVDGLSGMGGRGSEVELYSRHSKELKELANKWNILVILICHVSKGATKFDRDLSSKVRGSEKIIDNCDFYITSSLFNSEDNEKNKYYGNLRLMNKRGTGNTIDQIYDFDDKHLELRETDFTLDQFEIKQQDI